MSFEDFEKAFDNVNWNILFELLQKIEISSRDGRIMHSLYTKLNRGHKMPREQRRSQNRVRCSSRMLPISLSN